MPTKKEDESPINYDKFTDGDDELEMMVASINKRRPPDKQIVLGPKEEDYA